MKDTNIGIMAKKTPEQIKEEIQQKKVAKLHVKAIEAAKKPGVYFIEDIIALIPISKDTFYRYWKVGSDDYDAIAEILDENKVATKVEIRNKLAEGSKAPELTALYKLLATDDERRKLSSSYIDHTSKGKELKAPTQINYGNLSDETLEDIVQNTEKPEEKKETDGE